MVERMRMMSEWGLSDHRPKLLRVRKAVKKWRRSGQSKRRVLKMKCEEMQDEGRKEEYAKRTRQLWEEGEWNESLGEWEKVREVMVGAAKEMRGGCEKETSNSWVIGHEEVIGSMLARVNEAVNEKNKCMPALNARGRMRTRVSADARNRRDE